MVNVYIAFLAIQSTQEFMVHINSWVHIHTHTTATATSMQDNHKFVGENTLVVLSQVHIRDQELQPPHLEYNQKTCSSFWPSPIIIP